MILDDITFVQNISQSKTLPNRKSGIVNIADIEFTSLPHVEFAGSDDEFQFQSFNSAVALTSPPLPLFSPPKATVFQRPPSPQVVGFIPLQQFLEIQDATQTSLSSLPVRPGLLQDALVQHVMLALEHVIRRASDGIQGVWGSRHISLPVHFIEAIKFVATSCNALAATLTSQNIATENIPTMWTFYLNMTKLVVDIAKVIDGMDFLSLIHDSTCLDIGNTLQSTLAMLISDARRFPSEVEETLESIATALPTTLPALLLPSRFTVYAAHIDYLLIHVKHRLIEESTVSASTVKKVAHLIAIAKHIGLQLERLADEEHKFTERYRQRLIVFDGHYDMLKAFLEGARLSCAKEAFKSFVSARETAQVAGEKEVEAECLYRMVDIVISRGPIDEIDPRFLINSARELQSSDEFQQRLSSLLEMLRRNEIAMLLQFAAAVHENITAYDFITDVRMFVGLLLAKYPCEGVDAGKVLEGDFTRGILKLVRVYHPDKNASRDEEWRWVCEEVTKVFPRNIWLIEDTKQNAGKISRDSRLSDGLRVK
jgi:hypothetical protein